MPLRQAKDRGDGVKTDPLHPQYPKIVAMARSSDERAGGVSCHAFRNDNAKYISDNILPPLLSPARHISINICFVSVFTASRFSNHTILGPRSLIPAQLPPPYLHTQLTQKRILSFQTQPKYPSIRSTQALSLFSEACRDHSIHSSAKH